MNKKGSLYNLLWFLWRILKEMPIIFIMVFSIPIISGVLNVFIYSAQAEIIDIISYHLNGYEWKVMLYSLVIPIGIMAGISILRLSSEFLQKVLGNRLKNGISIIFRKQITDKAYEVEYVHFDDKEFCNKLKRAEQVVGEDLINILFNFESALVIGSSLFSVILLTITERFYVVSIIIMLMIVVNLCIKMRSEIIVRKFNREMTLEGRTGDYLRDILSNSKFVREMRIYNSASYFMDLWKKTIKYQHNKRMTKRRSEIKIGMITTTIQSISIFIVLYLLIKDISMVENISIGLISTIFLALVQSGNKILTLTWPLSKLYINCTRLYDFHEFMTYPSAENQSIDLAIPIHSVNMENVNFRYKNSESDVLSNINLDIKKNEKVVIVGNNGAGKSTLIKCIIGLYEPNEGQILWNHERKRVNNFSIILQNYIKFEMTLRENISLGNLKQINNDELIIETLRKCNCYDIYEKFGDLDVPLGRNIENGQELSGGQWQKLAIARALFSDSNLLIFDEPTSAIDPKTEVEIMKNIFCLSENKTAIFISHRLGWAKNANRIIVIDNGRVIEQGTHTELINKLGAYYKMYSLQASWYRE